MKKFLSPQLRRLFLVGVNNKRLRIDNKKIILANQITSLVILTSLLFSLLTLCNKQPIISFTVFGYGLLYLLTFYLHHIGSIISARNMLMFLSTTEIGIFSYFLGFHTGAIFYLFPVLISMGYIFPYKHIKELVFQILYVTIMLIFIMIIHFDGNIAQVESSNFIFWMNFVYSFIYSAIIVILYSYRSQKDLEAYSKKLELRDKARSINSQAIKEREVLIAEIHHRVKNNLSVIISMINLQLSDDLTPESRKVLQECNGRITSMSLVHEKLYNQDDLSNVDVKDYIYTLVDDVKSSYVKENQGITINFDIDTFYVNINQAVPIGLILNELISNAFKHAFKGKEDGILDIKCNNIGKQIILTVNDNGQGFDTEAAQEKSSLGLTIIDSLTEQLNATSEYSSRIDKGTKFIISFSKS